MEEVVANFSGVSVSEMSKARLIKPTARLRRDVVNVVVSLLWLLSCIILLAAGREVHIMVVLVEAATTASASAALTLKVQKQSVL